MLCKGNISNRAYLPFRERSMHDHDDNCMIFKQQPYPYHISIYHSHSQILRKLSFTDATSQPAQMVQRCSNRNRYVQQINRTPNRCKIAPSPEHAAIHAFQASPSNSMVFADYHHTNNNHPRTKLNLKKCFQAKGGKHNSNHVRASNEADLSLSPPSAHSSNTYCDEEIIFTENKIYVSMAERTTRPRRPTQQSPCENNATNEIIFEKVKLNRRNEQAMVHPVAHTCAHSHPSAGRQLCPFETSTDVSVNGSMHSTSLSYDYGDGSPCKHLNEYENLNESFWQSHNTDCSVDNGNRTNERTATEARSTYAETWDFIGINRITPVPIPATANVNMVQNKYEIHYESAVSASSRRTSISTTETWIDDETFDNSFNEELEKRCAKLCTKCH